MPSESNAVGRRRGMTLVEFLVVIMIIGVLLTVLVPAIHRSRAAARRVECQNNLRQLGLALYNYHDLHDTLPSGWTGVTEGQPAALGGPGWGWGAQLLPQLNQSMGVLMARFDLPIGSIENQRFRELEVPTFLCPDNSSETTWQLSGHKLLSLTLARSNYVGAFGSGGWTDESAQRVGETLHGDGLFYHNSSTRFVDVTDGLTHTVMVGERAHDILTNRHSTWVGVVPGVVDPISLIVGTGETSKEARATSARGFSSPHGSGSYFVFGDGRVQYVDGRVVGDIFGRLMSRAGEEMTPEF